jgi:hypothetical protein
MLFESVTLTAKLKVPLVVGVPETAPELVLKVSPAGSWPDEIENV